MKNLKIYKIYYNNKSLNDQLKNGRWPKRYRAEFIEPGICSYEDLGMGIIYVGSEALDKMNASFIGKPVVNELHQDLTPEQAFKLSDKDLESMADGVVYEVGKLENGWYYCDMIIWDEETQNNIDMKDYTVSCAYIVDKVGSEGKHHEIHYDEEVLNGTYTHQCIVSNPRYEKATIYELPSTYQNNRADDVIKLYKNSKGEKDMSKIFRYLFNSKDVKKLKNQPEEDDKNKKTEKPPEEDDKEMKNMEGAMIEVDGQQIPLEEAVQAYQAMKSNGEGEQPRQLTAEDQVDVDGELVNVSDLIAACQGRKQNAEPPQDEAAETVVEEQDTVQNSKGAKKKGKDFFKIVRNAAKKEIEERVYVNTTADRFKKGNERYGSNKEVK